MCSSCHLLLILLSLAPGFFVMDTQFRGKKIKTTKMAVSWNICFYHDFSVRVKNHPANHEEGVIHWLELEESH